MYAVYEEKGHQHWRTKIADSRGNTKKLWHTMRGILGENQSGRRDDSDCSAEDFAKFFADKVDSIRTSTSSTPPQDIADTASHVINEWKPVTPVDVEKLISSSSSKTCQLDPAPTWLVKEFGTLLSPFICLLFNQSLATGCFPRSYGHAVVLPLLKKNNLDASQPKNFRPVSNLCYLSKLLETVMQK